MSDRAAKRPRNDDRCYHGTSNGDGHTVAVELFQPKGEPGKPIGMLPADGPAGGFNWGFIGTGTNTTAKAILTDALGYVPSQRLWQDFADDVLSQCPAEFRLRRGAVLRWVRGWAAEGGVVNLPAVLADLPPIDHTAYDRRPAKGDAS
jgi:hypothetical protein